MLDDRARSLAAYATSVDATKRLEDAGRKLEEVLESSSGIPIRPIDPEDSLAVSIEGARSESSIVLQSSRSRRSLRMKTAG